MDKEKKERPHENRKTLSTIILPKLKWMGDSMISIIKGLEKTSRVRWLMFVLFLCAVSLIIMNINPGEKYSKQGGSLYHRIINIIIADGYCHDKQDCYRKDVIFGEHGNRVNLNLYGIQDRKIIVSVLSMVAAEGMKITGGVPMTVRFFSKPKKELMGFKSFTKNPAIIMEVNE